MILREYAVPLHELRREHRVVNSRFIASIAPAFGIEEARAFMARIRSDFADDGEPAGTSGKPALAVLRGSGLGDVVLVITRYFGGTLLGTGGLVKAYTESTQLVVTAVGRGERVHIYVAMVAIPYNLLERVRLMVKRNHGEVLSEDF